MAGFPRQHCRVLASSVDGSAAFVVLDTGPAERPYLYAGIAERVEGGWIDGSSGNGPSAGWRCTGRLADQRGVAYIYDVAPAGVDRVRAAFGADVREVAVTNGVYLATWWDVPNGDYPSPVPVAFHLAGEWVPDGR